MVITGASRGIGAATARVAAERGHDVCGTIAGLVNNAGILERQLRVEPKAPPHAKR